MKDKAGKYLKLVMWCVKNKDKAWYMLIFMSLIPSFLILIGFGMIVVVYLFKDNLSLFWIISILILINIYGFIVGYSSLMFNEFIEKISINTEF